MFCLKITTQERKKDKMVQCINRIASQINVTRNSLGGLADAWKNKAKTVTYSKDHSKAETHWLLPALYLLLKYHSRRKTVDTSCDFTYQQGACRRDIYIPDTKELDHRSPWKVENKDIKINTCCQRDSMKVNQSWYDTLTLVWVK